MKVQEFDLVVVGARSAASRAAAGRRQLRAAVSAARLTMSAMWRALALPTGALRQAAPSLQRMIPGGQP